MPTLQYIAVIAVRVLLAAPECLRLEQTIKGYWPTKLGTRPHEGLGLKDGQMNASWVV
jgi:hypothetical protein